MPAVSVWLRSQDVLHSLGQRARAAFAPLFLLLLLLLRCAVTQQMEKVFVEGREENRSWFYMKQGGAGREEGVVGIGRGGNFCTGQRELTCLGGRSGVLQCMRKGERPGEGGGVVAGMNLRVAEKGLCWKGKERGTT